VRSFCVFFRDGDDDQFLAVSFFFLMELWEVESILDPRGTAAMYWPTVPVPCDCEDGEVGGIKCG
jgi:hypothetical protein